MTTPSGMHLIASGRVQGVFYRKFCQEQARKRDLTGWAKNLSDGRVEVKAYGDAQALTAYAQKLQEGPMFAKVTGLSREEIPYEDYEGFDVY